MAMALEGVKVLDLATVWAAPGCAMYLADQGADVIKVESPAGDDSRRLLTHRALGNESPSFLVINRNKRGIVVDIRKPAGREIIRKLALQSSVLIHNFRPQVAKRHGLSYEELEQLNPGLIYVQLSAYGQKGPFSERPGYDLLFQALSGMMHRSAPDGTPIGAGIWAADCSTPMGLAYGVALALLQREKTGRGQVVETSLLQMAIAMQDVDLVRPEAEPPTGRASANQATFAPYRAQDDRWFLPVAVSDREWEKLSNAIGLPHLADDPAFKKQQDRAENAEQLFQVLEAVYATKPLDDWLRILEERDVPCAPVLQRSEVFSHPQVVENEMMTEVDHPTAGSTKMMGVPIRLSKNQTSVRHRSPLQGEHTVEVLKELGYSDEAIGTLVRDEVIPAFEPVSAPGP